MFPFDIEDEEAMPEIEEEKELEEWLSYMAETPTMNEELTAYIEKEENLPGERSAEKKL